LKGSINYLPSQQSIKNYLLDKEYPFDKIFVNTHREHRWQRFASQYISYEAPIEYKNDPENYRPPAYKNLLYDLYHDDMEEIMRHNHRIYDYDSIHYTALDPSFQALASITTRIQAYDGNLMNRTQWVLDGKQREEHPSDRGRELRKGELASSETHRWIWQKIIDMDLDAALILEDDAELVTAQRTMTDVNMCFKKLPPLLINSGQSHTFDILYLGYNWVPMRCVDLCKPLTYQYLLASNYRI
jgi:hypothetical protein